MRRTTIAALLAAPLLLAFPGFTPANPPKQCYRGQGCGGFCLLNFSRIHQIGPLFNYGPYYGYPPFEPYGPWNAYLQYNGRPYGQRRRTAATVTATAATATRPDMAEFGAVAGTASTRPGPAVAGSKATDA